MLMRRCTAAQFAEIQPFGVHCQCVYRWVRRGCPYPGATRRFFSSRSRAAHGRVQEPAPAVPRSNFGGKACARTTLPPGSAVKHCRFLDKGGGRAGTCFHDRQTRHRKQKLTTKHHKKPLQRRHRHPKRKRRNQHPHNPTSKQTGRPLSPPTPNTKERERGRQKTHRAKEKSEVPFPHALHCHNGPPPTLGPHHTYRRTSTPAPYGTESAQALHLTSSATARQ